MNSLYESILSSTKSGKRRFLTWSKRYFHDEYKKSAKDFCKFYDIDGLMEKEQIKDLFYDFVLRVNVESFRFVEDLYTEERVVDSTKITAEEIKDKMAFNIKKVHVYLIIRTDDDKCYIWTKNTQMFDRVYYSGFLNYLLA